MLITRMGITVDSGAGAFVMPEIWFPGIPTKPSRGSIAGQKFIGATGNCESPGFAGAAAGPLGGLAMSRRLTVGSGDWNVGLTVPCRPCSA